MQHPKSPRRRVPARPVPLHAPRVVRPAPRKLPPQRGGRR